MSFIENVNLIAEYIRGTNQNIYDDINMSVEQAHKWASLLGSEPDPVGFPGELSSQAYAILASDSLDELQAMTVDADTVPAGDEATAVYDPSTNHIHFGLPQGETGIRGSFWYMLPYIPTVDLGRVGDAGLNTTTFDLYYKVNVSGTPTWTYYGNIKGEKGDQGIQGDIGDEGPEGPQGPRGPRGEPGMGLYPQTEVTVAEMNAIDLTAYPTGSMWLMEDDGTIINPVGSTPVPVTALDWVGLGADGYLMNLGAISGPEGPQGDQGIQGDAATVDAGTASSIPFGDAPTVSNSGTTSEAVFDFEIPLGEVGATGAKGDTGDTGTHGIDGAPGELWYLGTADPADIIGIDGDLFLNTNTSDYFEKSAGTWQLRGNLQGIQGIQGIEGPASIVPGPDGVAATVTAGNATALPAGAVPTVDDSRGTPSAAIFDFGIPAGAQGAKGDVGLTGAAGELWYLVTSDPTTGGKPGDLALNTVTNDYFENQADVWILIGNLHGAQGDKGDTGDQGVGGTVAAGTTTTLAAGEDADVTEATGSTPENAIFDFAIPQGIQGVTGAQGDFTVVSIGSVDSVPSGTAPTVVDGDPGDDVILNFELEAGVQGDKGDQGSAGLNGEKWYLLSQPPVSEGAPGDLALDTTTSLYYENQSGTWAEIGTLQGATGADSTVPGPTGIGGTTAAGTTTTLASTEDASVTEATGSTPESTIWDFGIPQGIQGVIGLTGDAATISVTPTTITGNAGTDASVANTGTTSAADYEFTIPRGDKGDKGDAGTGLIFQGYEDPAVVVTLTATEIGEAYTANVSGVDSDGTAMAIDDVMVAEDLASPSHWVTIGAIQGPQGTQGETGARGPAGLVPVGERTVAEVNALDFATLPTGTIFIMTDAGTITTGPAPVDVVADDWLGKTADDVWVNMGPLQGDTGDTGATGTAATITVGVVTTGAEGTDVIVTDTDPDASAATFDFTIPIGDTGAAGADGNDGATGGDGPAGTPGSVWFILAQDPVGEGVDGDLALNTVTSDYFEKISGIWTLVGNLQGIQGTKGDTGDDGIAATISVTPTTVTGDAGTDASVVNSGTTAAADYEFTIPRGDVGAAGADAIAPIVSVGTVTSVPSGTAPTVVDSDPGVDVTLDFTLEAGVQGDAGVDGTHGDPGELWYVAANDPDIGTGINGDLALNSATSDYFEKQLDVWVLIGNLQGTPGTNGLDSTVPGPDGEDGNTWFTSTVDPVAGDGADGDLWQNITTDHYWTKAAGAWTDQGTLVGPSGTNGTNGTDGDPGTDGTNGTNGVDGNIWLTGTVDPLPADGIDDDLYLNTSTDDYFQKITGTWVLQGNLQGADGSDGSDGGIGGDGPAGTAATITVGVVTTGIPGSDVIIIDTDPDASAATFDFTIPRGDDGTPGAAGPSAVSTDAGNVATIGLDALIYVPAVDGGTY